MSSVRPPNAQQLEANKSTGFMVVLSSPSGGGKTTILKRLLDSGDPDFRYSISATTRSPRDGERHGRDYYFLGEDEFHRKVKNGEFLEYAFVHGKYYGTLRRQVLNWIDHGKIVLMDLDVQGGLNVKKQLGERAILIFVQPPSFDSLRERLSARNTDSHEEISARLQVAATEMEASEKYDHVVVNHQIDETVVKVLEIINRYRTGGEAGSCRPARTSR